MVQWLSVNRQEPPTWAVWLESEYNQVIFDNKTASPPAAAQLLYMNTPRLETERKLSTQKTCHFTESRISTRTFFLFTLWVFLTLLSLGKVTFWVNWWQRDAINGLQQRQQASDGSVLYDCFWWIDFQLQSQRLKVHRVTEVLLQTKDSVEKLRVR